eukprot:scaffold131920_cov72-Phaeocystis_antarctica.AAC.7
MLPTSIVLTSTLSCRRGFAPSGSANTKLTGMRACARRGDDDGTATATCKGHRPGTLRPQGQTETANTARNSRQPSVSASARAMVEEMAARQLPPTPPGACAGTAAAAGTILLLWRAHRQFGIGQPHLATLGADSA